MQYTHGSDKPRIIAPGSILLKCIDGRWIDIDGLTPTGEMVAVATTRGLQRFNGKGEPPAEILEQPDKRLTQDDADVLNAKIPVQEWRDDLNGEPDPPWKLVHVAYLINIDSATRYTFVNSTFGAMRAVERLEDRLLCLRMLHGAGVRPIVKLASRPMKTKKGEKLRPHFEIVDKRDFSGSEGTALLGGGTPLLEHHKTETATETLSTRLQTDKVDNREGFRVNDVEVTPKTPAKAKTTVGKPVKPVSISEGINDSLPGDLAPPVNPLKGD